MGDISALLPDSLNLPPHLSAHKYFYVCTLTVAAWDTLVLSPRDWRLLKTNEWPVLKVIFQILRYLMPIDFIVTSVAFFHTEFTLDMCQRFYLFEPIVTMILVCLCSAVHVIRVHAIYDKSRAILGGLGLLLLLQVATMAVACAFYKVMILKPGQGCIAGPIASWVGIYWVAPTFFFSVSFALALARSLQSLSVKKLSPWKLMLRDGLNLYAAIWLVNMVNMLFWFIVQPQDQPGIEDTIRTMVTSMTAVLTTTMTMRIILSVRGSLSQGGAYAGTSTAGSGSRSGTTHVISRPPPPGGFSTHSQGGGVLNIGNNPTGTYTGAPYAGGRGVAPTYTLDEMRGKAEREYMEDGDGKSSLAEGKEMPLGSVDSIHGGHHGVKVTIDREVDYHGRN